MKNSKKAICIALIGVALTTSFLIGGYAEATSDFLSTVLAEAKKQIGSAGYNKKEELINNIDTEINKKIATKVNPIADEKAKKVQDELQTYFDSKIDAIVPDTEPIETELENQVTEIYNRYKQEIDNAFSSY